MIDEVDREILDRVNSFPLELQNTFWTQYNMDKASIFRYYLILIPFGLQGFHKAYLRKRDLAIVYFLTFGFLGIGYVYDIIMGWKEVKNYNKGAAIKSLSQTQALLVYFAKPGQTENDFGDTKNFVL